MNKLAVLSILFTSTVVTASPNCINEYKALRETIKSARVQMIGVDDANIARLTGAQLSGVELFRSAYSACGNGSFPNLTPFADQTNRWIADATTNRDQNTSTFETIDTALENLRDCL